MPTRIIQNSFASGEVSPPVYARTDITKYQSALKKLRNFIIHPTGGISNRPGTRFVARAKYSDKLCILKEFVFSSTQKYVIEVGHEYMRFFTSGASINISSDIVSSWNSATTYDLGDYVTYNGSTIYYSLTDNTNVQPDIYPLTWAQQSIYEIPTPYQEEDLRQLKFEPSADTIFITHPDYQPRVLERYGSTDWRLSLYEAEEGPFMLENIDETISMNVSAVSGSITLTAASSVFVDAHVGSIFRLSHYIEGQTAATAFGSSTTGTAIKCFTTWRIITHGTWTGKLKIEKSSDGGVTWTSLRAFSSSDDFNANTSGTEDIELNDEPFLVRANMYSYTSGTCNVDLTTDAFYQEGIVKITSINSSTSAQADVLKEVGDTSNTISWAEGSWSNYRGWPAVCRFFQDRLCFAGTYSEPMTIWMTETGNYYSFKRHSVLLDTDSITANLPSRQVNIINNLISFKRLLALTSTSVWSIGPVDGKAMSPTGFTQEIEEYSGSNGVNPVVIGNEAIYMQEHGHVVRNIGYQFQNDSFVGGEANILSRHLFDAYEIIDMAYQRNPNNIVWMLRDDGKLVGMTYLREQDIVGFHWHDTGVVD